MGGGVLGGGPREAAKQAEGLQGDCTRGKHQQPATAAAAAAIDHVYHSGARATASHLSGGFAYFLNIKAVSDASFERRETC